jgi:hypothetical protein
MLILDLFLVKHKYFESQFLFAAQLNFLFHVEQKKDNTRKLRALKGYLKSKIIYVSRGTNKNNTRTIEERFGVWMVNLKSKIVNLKSKIKCF